MQTAVNNIQDVVTALVKGETPLGDIREHLRDPRAVVRVNALNALVPHTKIDDELIGLVIAAAKNPINEIRLMGTISVAHVAVGCLYQVGTPTALGAATELLATWPEPDRSDLRWYLQSEGHAPA